MEHLQGRLPGWRWGRKPGRQGGLEGYGGWRSLRCWFKEQQRRGESGPLPPPQESSLGGSGPAGTALSLRIHLSLLPHPGSGPSLCLCLSVCVSPHFYLFPSGHLFPPIPSLFRALPLPFPQSLSLSPRSLLLSLPLFLFLPLCLPPCLSEALLWFALVPHGPLAPGPRPLEDEDSGGSWGPGPWDREAGPGRTPGAPAGQEAAPETRTNPGVRDPRPGPARPPTLSLPGTFPRFLSGKAISALPPSLFWVPEEPP